jgi:hypothetical protein
VSEYEIQSTFVEAIANQYPNILFCATVGGARMSISEAKKIKRSGYRKGIPDVIFYEPRNGYYGLCIEIKKKGGRTSPHQNEWRADLLKRGYQSVVCKGLDECVQQFNNYFRLRLIPQAVGAD